jgi:hypothetical protein
MAVTADDVNFLVFRYLQESGALPHGRRFGALRRPRVPARAR